MKDLRSQFFGGLEWYESLSPPEPQDYSAWYVAHSTEDDWAIATLNAGLAFALEHGLEDRYRTLFGGIRPQDLLFARAQAEHRTVSLPIWEIANELIVGRYLQCVTGWKLETHEPAGRHGRKGDWGFRTPTDRRVFVEVKTLAEPEYSLSTGVYSKPDYRPRIRSALARGYSQLPDDGRATLIVVVGKEMLRIPFGIMHGDLFQSLYGQMQVRFNVMPYNPQSVRMTPSFRDMFVHGSKHRRLGAVAGMVHSGTHIPRLRLYAVHNPYANSTAQMIPEDLPDTLQFHIDSDGHGRTIEGIGMEEVWRRME